ncbi:hypothetical protein PGIGA_G00159230 [Pangasianodon gigas]|uniref:Uncharacterized protein n=1 Tax=Pangasianodon gigas TaxID=30993 RepID=A0ACC5XRL5_PANGG|nr:hypothetical protein [Pangasianodon gigas]
MLKFVLLLCVAVAGSNARPLQYNTLRIQNGGWVIGAPQLVQNGQEYMGNFGSAEHHRQDTNAEPQWEVVLAPEHTEKMQDDTNQKVAPIEEHRQGTEPSRRFLVDLNTGLLKEYISEMDRSVEVYNPASNSAFRQGTQNSRVTLVDTRTGQQLPQLSEMQRRAAPLSQFRQGTEYNEALLMELRKAQMIESMETAKFTVINLPFSTVYNPASNSAFRQGTQNSRVTLVDTRTGQQLPQLSEMQRRAAPYGFRQGTEYNLMTLWNLRNAQMIHTKVGKDKTPHTVQDMETNEVFPEFKRGIEYSQAQRQQIMDQHLFQALESNEVDISPPMEEFRHGMEYSHGNVIDRRIMEPSYVKQNDEVSTCQGEVIAGKCYIFNPKLQTFGEAEDVQNW